MILWLTRQPQTAVDPNGDEILDGDNVTMYLPQHPGIELVKEVNNVTLSTAKVGDLISYTLTITNTGDVSPVNNTLTDELEGISLDTSSLNGLTLNPGEAAVITAEYALTDVDLEPGSVYNHATVAAESTVPYNEANTWSGPQQVSNDDDVLVDGIAATTDELTLSQTGIKYPMICGAVLLATTVGIITYSVNRKKNISNK